MSLLNLTEQWRDEELKPHLTLLLGNDEYTIENFLFIVVCENITGTKYFTMNTLYAKK